jgi:hypothetical protein
MKNMTELRLGDQFVLYDRDATLAAYVRLQRGSAEMCGCDACRNVLAQRDSVYLQHFLKLLDQLGIDLTKEGDLYEEGPPENNVQPCAGWFYFVGELVEAGERLTEMGKDFQCFIRGAGTTSVTKLFGDSVCALEFTARVPWVLDAPYDTPVGMQMKKAEEIMARYSNTLRKLAE